MNTKVNATIIKETEKAYQLTVEYWTSDTTPIKTATMWVPKSQCTVDAGQVTEIADWILNQWVAQRNDYMKKNGYSTHRHSICFDMAEYEHIKAVKKAKQEAFRAEVQEALEATVAYVKPYADRYMSELAHDAQFIYDNYKDSGILPTEIVDAINVIAAEISKEFGSSAAVVGITKEIADSWWDTFVEKHNTFESVRDYLWFELGEHRCVYGVNLFGYETRNKIKMSNGMPVSESILSQVIGGTTDPKDTLLGKKFKKNWDLYNRFIDIVNRMFYLTKK